MADAPNNMPDITELINALFTNHPHPDGREVTALEITLATNGKPDASLALDWIHPSPHEPPFVGQNTPGSGV